MAEEFVTVLVVRHPQGISYEGAIGQRNRADKELQRTLDLEVVGATTGLGDAAGEALGILMRAWGGEL